MKSQFTRCRALLAFALLALAGTAQAHVGHEGGHAATFLSGLVHPVSGIDHLLAMVAVGLWSAMTTRRVWLAPITFAAMLLVGAMLGLSGLELPAVEPMIASSLLVLGLLVATKAQVPAALAAGIVGLFAVFHGVAHGTELAGGGNGWMPLVGMLMATIGLHLVGVGAGLALRTHSIWWPRVAGGLVSLLGGAFLLHLV